MIPPLFAIFAWPVIVAILFARLKPTHAIVWSILGAYLFLPNGGGLDLPLVPVLDKESVPALAVFLAAIIAAARASADAEQNILPGWIPQPAAVRLCLAGVVLGVIGTTVTNGDTLGIGRGTIQGLRLYDAGSLILGTAPTLIPMLLARRFLGHPKAHKTLLIALAAGGLAYSLLALYEVRMSPQLNAKIYGFFPHMWNQHVRGGGYRPVVFLQHGLWLSLFFSSAALACLVLFRGGNDTTRTKYLAGALWLLGTLFLSKSLGALAITLVLVPMILFLNTRLQMTVAAAISATVLTYPMLRAADLVPVDRVMRIAHSIDPGRAASLGVRLYNEDQLLAKANKRPLFGWGTWGRNRIYDETGRNLSTTDGRWIITAGIFGWVGYLSQFGLLTLGVLLLWRRSKHYEVTLITAGLAVVLAGNLIDLIPNSGLTPITWLMAGALIGRVEHGRLTDVPTKGTTGKAPARRYSRFGPNGEGPVHTRSPARLIREWHSGAP